MGVEMLSLGWQRRVGILRSLWRGAPVNKYFEKGTFRSNETMSCRYTIQTPIDLALADMEHDLLPPHL